jgi:hypothetical protein
VTDGLVVRDLDASIDEEWADDVLGAGLPISDEIELVLDA